MKMNVENWWDDTGRGKMEHSERNLPHCHIVNHKSDVDLSGIEPVPPR